MLVERHERKILVVARRMTRTREDAEDVVQQSFQKAFLHLHQFEGRSSFSTWLTRIAINEARMLQRGSRGVREVSIDDSNANEETASALEIPDASPDPETSYSQRERLRMLSWAINELPPGMREAIQLHELDERSTEETARIMGITVSALKGRMFHGRRKLRQRLQPYFGSAWMTGRETLPASGNTSDISRDPLPCNA
jgi:RNA polymerase sigma-70 factor (ECF subfamily)